MKNKFSKSSGVGGQFAQNLVGGEKVKHQFRHYNYYSLGPLFVLYIILSFTTPSIVKGSLPSNYCKIFLYLSTSE